MSEKPIYIYIWDVGKKKQIFQFFSFWFRETEIKLISRENSLRLPNVTPGGKKVSPFHDERRRKTPKSTPQLRPKNKREKKISYMRKEKILYASPSVDKHSEYDISPHLPFGPL